MQILFSRESSSRFYVAWRWNEPKLEFKLDSDRTPNQLIFFKHHTFGGNKRTWGNATEDDLRFLISSIFTAKEILIRQ
jgi:hypothetical protein